MPEGHHSMRINRSPLLILFDKLPKRLRFFTIRKMLEPQKK
jgi:hypothetical protein